MFKLDFDCSNNEIEYEALIVSLNILSDMSAQFIKIMGVIKQLSGEYQCLNKNIIH